MYFKQGLINPHVLNFYWIHLTLNNLPKSNSELQFEPIGFDNNGKSSATATKRKKQAYDDIARQFTDETGISLKKHGATRAAQELLSWALKNSSAFGIEGDEWFDFAKKGYFPFKSKNEPLYDRIWNTGYASGGNCELVNEWMAGVLQSLGIYSLDLSGHIHTSLKYSDPSRSGYTGHAMTYFHDKKTKRDYFFDFQNDCILGGEVILYSDAFEIYEETGYIAGAFDSTSMFFDDLEGDSLAIFNKWYNPAYGSKTIVIDGWKLSGAATPTVDLPFNLGSESKLWLNWSNPTRNLIAPRLNEFGASQGVTRAELVAFLVHYMRSPAFKEYEDYFSDTANHPLAFHIATAVDMGLIGKGGEFNPDTPINRRDAATILSRAVAWSRKNGQAAKLTIDGKKNPSAKLSKISAVSYIVRMWDQS